MSFRVLLSLPLFLTPLWWWGCGVSEETGVGKVSTPVHPTPLAAQDSLRLDSLRVKRGGFTSEADTVTAAVVKTTKRTPRVIKPIIRPEHPAYTVQIGAFARTMYALQSQKIAKERFPDLPIFNYFEPFDKLYRVRVGKFDTRAQADSLRKVMMKSFPEDYAESWVNYIAK
jgi:cell division septation protein DedD